ncbi:molybdopterin synthase catalytic subunit-like [Macrosteles quadrilineatus]|uniref:molybdopterin synthase catalytic subunit-like n=1 Tax=Macrosteles quadrilineatus TaxID=74068 RepID=UPI0023E1FD7A|nr:molybdopterin synthase catalytic subunit-like [Macrosteles quadrilineatus]
MDFVKLLEDRLNIDEISELVKSPKCGAVSLFIGTTRDNCDGYKVAKLVYEAYEQMALKSMKRVCVEIRQKWPEVENIAVYHRLGDCPVMEASVVIAVSSPHRQASLQAVQFAIETLKASVPVWKKEEYEGGVEPSWKENKECPWSSSTS